MADDEHVVTDGDLQNLEPGVNALAQALQDHSQKSLFEAHGGLTNTSTSTYDNSSGENSPHRTGRNGVKVLVNNAVYMLPADVNADGPPKVPIITTQPQTVQSLAPDGDPQQNVSWTIEVSPTSSIPLTFTWQVFDIDFSSEFEPVLGLTGLWVDIVPGKEYRMRVGKPSRFDTSVDPTAFSSEQATTKVGSSPGGSSSGKVYQNVMAIRCNVSNAGGSVTSNVAYLHIKDITKSCVMLTTALSLGYVDRTALIDMVRYRLSHQRSDWFQHQAWLGYLVTYQHVAKWLDHPHLGQLVKKVTIDPFITYVRWRLGKVKTISPLTWAYSQVLYAIAVVGYYFQKEEADALYDKDAGPKDLLRRYLPILRRSKPSK